MLRHGSDYASALHSKSENALALLGASGDDALPGPRLEYPVVIEVSAELKRCGGEVSLILPLDSPGIKPHPAQSLIRAISRAHDWVDRIVRGEVANQRSLARETGLDERYISRIISLAFLAPDLTEQILDGKQAARLSLDGCLGNIPADWNQQWVQLLGK